MDRFMFSGHINSFPDNIPNDKKKRARKKWKHETQTVCTIEDAADWVGRNEINSAYNLILCGSDV